MEDKKDFKWEPDHPGWASECDPEREGFEDVYLSFYKYISDFDCRIDCLYDQDKYYRYRWSIKIVPDHIISKHTQNVRAGSWNECVDMMTALINYYDCATLYHYSGLRFTDDDDETVYF